jgi:exodeoxyribonuclease V gamma subunit
VVLEVLPLAAVGISERRCMGESMNSIRLFMSNRLDLLARELAGVLETPLESPFNKETVLVQSKGMERWLSMQIATRLGVCANCKFPFPNAFVQDIFRQIIPGLPEHSVFDPMFCTWRIMEVLPGCLEKPGFENLRNYLECNHLETPGHTLKLLQLSQRIAETFDQYIIYRPEFLDRWESGEEQHWQAVLWREVVRGREHENRAALGNRVLSAVMDASAREMGLPRRVSIFGISYLPPFHINILAGLSRLMEIKVFLLNPCREYWGDIASNRDIRRVASGKDSAGFSPEDLYLEKGNTLLASMGTMGRDFFDLITSFECEETAIFEDPCDKSMLGRIQSDILNLRETAGPGGKKVVVSKEDGSVRIHSCHSPMREVEVLYDHLLEMFENDPGLMPKDILVMTPDVESYAPFIQAVFDNPENERKKIPFSIADRSMRKESRIIDTFLDMLDLRGERITAPQVLGILEAAPVHSRFDIAASDMDLVLKWVRDVRIRWGIDEESRRQWCPSPFRENTWSAGIERLLLGYAMPGGGERLFQGILPYDDIEGSNASVLGHFLNFIDALFEFLSSLGSARTLGEWADFLSRTASRFFNSDENSKLEMRAIGQALENLRQIQEITGFDSPLDLELIRWHLGRQLEQGGFGLGFMTGGVTFCSMLPMRSIPFKVICLIGMNENEFPRQSKPAEFDLIAKNPRPGDRSVRNEDRYVFLEALLSAREKLYISYTGQNCKDNSLIPPSVLVSELIDAINKGFGLPGADHRDWFLIRDRLQAFNPDYFKGDAETFSYSDEYLAAARCILAKKRKAPIFIQTSISGPDEAFRSVSVTELCRFFRNPAKFLLNRRLGIYLEEDRFVPDETEAFELRGLERYGLEQDLLESVIGGGELKELLPIARASGMLPPGVPGECTYADIGRKIELFASQTVPHVGRNELEPLTVDFRLGDFNITGRVRPIYPQRVVHYRYAVLKAKDYLGLWIKHLILNLCRKPGYPEESMLIGLTDGKEWQAFAYKPVQDGAGVLRGLLDLYWEGLTRPVHFFPQTSFGYACNVLEKRKPREKAMEEAQYRWTTDGFHGSESDDPYFQLCFKSSDPLDSEFESIC